MQNTFFCIAFIIGLLFPPHSGWFRRVKWVPIADFRFPRCGLGPNHTVPEPYVLYTFFLVCEDQNSPLSWIPLVRLHANSAMSARQVWRIDSRLGNIIKGEDTSPASHIFADVNWLCPFLSKWSRGGVLRRPAEMKPPPPLPPPPPSPPCCWKPGAIKRSLFLSLE